MTYVAWGFDYAYGSGLTTAQLQAAGCQFVCRYLSGTPGAGKDVSVAEIKGLLAAGINVVLNWETTGQMPGEAQGIADAKAAQAEATELGYPDAVIYFSADFNPAGLTAQVNAYMTGVASAIGKARTGLYGAYPAVNAYMNAGIGDYAWQTYAWSNDQWDDRAQIQQWNNNYAVGPATVDQDRTTTASYGQLTAATFPAPGGLSSTPYVRVDLGWDAVEGAASYAAQVSLNGTLVYNQSVSAPGAGAIPLPRSGTYQWRVAVHATETVSSSPWTAQQSFTTP
jgi:hypothetical protein